MRNRFPGTCYVCGRHVPTGFGFFERVNYRKHGRKWLVKCVECTDGRKVKATDREVRRAEKLRDEWLGGGAE